jgi:hypothetical protein
MDSNLVVNGDVFSGVCPFTCHTYCEMEPPFLRSYPKNQCFSILTVKCVITTYFSV